MIVALHKGTGFIARAIQWQTRSRYSHVSIDLEDGFTVEAREFRGVRRLTTFEARAGESVDLFRVHPLSIMEEETIRDFLANQIGKPYDYTMVARFISRRQASREESGKWFCSELAFAAFKAAGVDLLARVEPWAVSPGLLSMSPLLTPIDA